MLYLGIDPSINGNAYCLMDPTNKTITTHKFSAPKNKRKDILDRLYLCYNDLTTFIAMNKYIHATRIVCVIEQPEKQTSERGTIAHETNKYVKLCAAFGATVASTQQRKFHTVLLATPSQWKGQVPKSITKKRMIKRYGTWVPFGSLERKTHDEIDAIGLADWAYVKNEPLSHRENTNPGNVSQGKDSI